MRLKIITFVDGIAVTKNVKLKMNEIMINLNNRSTFTQ